MKYPAMYEGRYVCRMPFNLHVITPLNRAVCLVTGIIDVKQTADKLQDY